MSRTVPNDHERGELIFGCLHCGASPGQWCVIAGTLRPAVWLHQNRWEQMRTVVALSGWDQMLKESDQRLSDIRRELWKLREKYLADGPVQADIKAVLAL